MPEKQCPLAESADWVSTKDVYQLDATAGFRPRQSPTVAGRECKTRTTSGGPETEVAKMERTREA